MSVLGFNPEREPFKSWTNRAWFWARLAKVPAVWFEKEAPQQNGRSSIDGVYGAMLDSRQVSKLPIVWLLLLLAAYLIIIGPVDRIWLKRINKQMLTWLTFPAYVAIFSLLIYFIGYKLRAGQLELNELHIVDVLPGQQEVMRGRSYVSIYSPLNDDYRLGGSFERSGIRSRVRRHIPGQHGLLPAGAARPRQTRCQCPRADLDQPPTLLRMARLGQRRRHGGTHQKRAIQLRVGHQEWTG